MAHKIAAQLKKGRLFILLFISTLVLTGLLVVPQLIQKSVAETIAGVFKNAKQIVFWEAREWQIASDAVLTTLRPTGDSTQSGTITESTGTTAWNLIDDDPDSGQPGSDYVYSGGAGTHYVDLDITDMPAGFGTMDTLSIDFYLANSGFSDDTVALTARLYQSDGSTTMSNSMSIGTQASSGYNTVAFTGLDTTSTSTTWDGALLRIQWVYSQTHGPDNGQLRVHAVELDGTYTAAGGNISQNHFRWRDDSAGLNSNSGWLAAEDQAATTSAIDSVIRLRVGLDNIAGATTTGQTYRLEYAERVGATCAGGEETFTTVPVTATTNPFEMATSSQYANQASTTASYLTSSSTTFQNGYGVEDPSNITGGQEIGFDGYTEIEYAIKPTSYASSTIYCFKVTNGGTDLDNYAQYAELEMRPDFSISAGDITVLPAIPYLGASATATAIITNNGANFETVAGGNPLIASNGLGSASPSFTMIDLRSSSPIKRSGKITKWSGCFSQVASDTTAKFKVFRTNGSNYDYIGQSSSENINNGTGCYGPFDMDIDVEAGDLVGIYFTSSDQAYVSVTSLTSGLVYQSGDITSDTAQSGWTSNNNYMRIRAYYDDEIEVNLWDGDPTGSGVAMGATTTVATLSYGATTSVSANWNVSATGTHAIYASIDYRTLINETDETNNIASTTIDSIGAYLSHYRWRSDLVALNTGGGWLATEDTALATSSSASKLRVRMAYEVAGTSTTANIQHRLEYAEKLGGLCTDDETYYPVPISSTATSTFEMATSSQYANYASTTAQLLSSYGYTAFINGYALEDPVRLTQQITVDFNESTEFEFAVEQNNTDEIGGNYCFRVGDPSGVTQYYYTQTPEVNVDWCYNWSNYKPIAIGNSLAATYTNMQVELTIDTQTLISQGKLQSQCQDLRFVDPQTGSRVAHWVANDSCNSATSSVWVKVPTMNANSITTLRMYYGNSNAADVSSGDEVFIFFDDFENNNFNKWDSNNSWTISSGTVKHGTYAAQSGTAFSQSIVKNFDEPYESGVLEMHINLNETTRFHYPMNMEMENGGGVYHAAFGSSANLFYWSGNGLSSYPNTLTYSASTWYFLKNVFDLNEGVQGKHWVWVDGTQQTNGPGISFINWSGSGLGTSAFTSWTLQPEDTGAPQFWVDDVRLRQLYATSTDPSVSVGSESTCPNPVFNYYRWRDDTTALNTSGGWFAAENTKTETVPATSTETYRLRAGIANTATVGNVTNGLFRLESAVKVGATCGDDETFYPVATTPVATSTFETALSAQYANGASTTASLLSNIATTTRVDGYGLEDPSNTTGAQTVNAGEFTELEFAIKNYATTTIGGNYCFQVSQNGSVVSGEYPEISFPWCDNWGYYMPVEIKNDTATTFTDLSVEVVVDTASLISGTKMQSQCQDLRFVDPTTADRIPHYVENCNSATSSIWVKLPSFPANATTTIRMYYDNPDAVDVANGDDVFIFFDDFEDNDLAEWDTSTNWSVGSSVVKWGTYSGQSGSDWGHLLSKSFDQGYEKGIYEGWVRLNETNLVHYPFNITFTGGGDGYFAAAANAANWAYWGASFTTYPNNSGYSTGQWYFVKSIFDFTEGANGTHWAWVDGTLQTNSGGVTIRKTSGAFGTSTNGWHMRSNAGATYYVDTVRFRQMYATGTEPTVTLGTEIGCGVTGALPVTGYVYNSNSSNALTECDGSGATFELSLRSRGATFQASCDSSTGAFTFTGVDRPVDGDGIVVWINGLSVYGALGHAYDGEGGIFDLTLWEDSLTLSGDGTTTVTNTILDNYDNGDDTDIPYTVTSGNLTVEPGFDLYVAAGKNYTPGGNVTTATSGNASTNDGDVYVEVGATMNMEANTLSVGGDLALWGSFSSTGTTTLTATSTGFRIVPYDAPVITHLKLSGSGGSWFFSDDLQIQGNLTLADGTLTNEFDVTVHGGTVAGDGTLTLSDGSYLENMKMVTGGAYQTCGVSHDGHVYCWGVDYNGELGLGTVGATSTEPTRVLKGAAVDEDSDGPYLANIKEVAVGFSHVCAVSNGGNLYCWGRDADGQLGNGATTGNQPLVQRVEDGEASGTTDSDGTYLINIKSVGAGWYYTCAATYSGRAYCWGDDTDGQLGNGTDQTVDQTTPTRVEDGQAAAGDTDGTWLINVDRISAGYFMACANSYEGNAYCWGGDNSEKLGDGTGPSAQPTPRRVLDGEATGSDTDGTNLINVKDIQAVGNGAHACALTNSGYVYCWGNYTAGQLGAGSLGSVASTPLQVHAGQATTTGDVSSGFLANIREISVGGDHTCAISHTGNTYCWGQTANGRVGDGQAVTDQVEPIRVLDGGAWLKDLYNSEGYLTNISHIGTTMVATCAVSNFGHIYCWGNDFRHQLGNGPSQTDFGSPTLVWNGEAREAEFDGENLINTKQVSSGNAHSCATTQTGRVYCWGSEVNGKLGNGAAATNRLVPVQVLDGEATLRDSDGVYLRGMKEVQVGRNHSCALADSGAVYCWGGDAFGQLGSGDNATSSTPVRVLAGEATGFDTDGTYLENIKQISVGRNYTCALSLSGNAYCWGSAQYGKLGDGQSSTNRSTPVRVQDGAAAAADTDGTYLTNINQIAAGSYHVCAVSNATSTYCWGETSNGQVGDAQTSTDRSTPVKVQDGSAIAYNTDGTYLINIKQIVAGEFHTCALSNATNTYCWGDTQYGQVGDAQTAADRSTPVRVQDGAAAAIDSDGTYLVNIRELTAGGYHTCAISNATSTYCWGYANSGRLGDGQTTTDRTTPVKVQDGIATGLYTDGTSLQYMKTMSAGAFHTCAVSEAGTTYCWGFSGNGQLGANNTTTYSTPVYTRRGMSNEDTSNTRQAFLNVLGTGTFGGNTTWSMPNLVFGDSISTDTTTAAGTASTTISRNMTIKLNHTLSAGAKDWYLTASGTPFVADGTLTPGTSSFYYTGTSTVNVATTTYYNLFLQPTSVSTYTITSGTLSVSNNLTVGDGTNAVTVTANSSDPTVDIGGDFTISASATYQSSNTNVLSIGGDYTNSGTFTANNGTTTFDGSAQQTLSGSMVGANAFYSLKITNNSGSDPVSSPSVIFTANASSTNFNVTTGDVKLRFQAGNGYEFTNFYINGQSTGSRVTMRSSTGGSAWFLYVSGTQSVQYANPQDSNASGGNEIDASDGTSLEGTGNTNWNFGGGGGGADKIYFNISNSQAWFGTLTSGAARFASSTNILGSPTETVALTLTASTTASNGYTITVRGDTLTSAASDTITPIGGTKASSTPGTEQFGMRLMASGGSGIVSAPYNDPDDYAYNATAGSTDVIASTSGSSVDTTYDVYLVSNIESNTEAGSYSTVITYVITANF